jgi:hypothetical protein
MILCSHLFVCCHSESFDCDVDMTCHCITLYDSFCCYLQIEIQPAIVKAASDETIPTLGYQRSTDAFEEKPLLAPIARVESFNEQADDEEHV